MPIVPVVTQLQPTHRLFVFIMLEVMPTPFPGLPTVDSPPVDDDDDDDDANIELYGVTWRQSALVEESKLDILQVIKTLRKEFLESGYVKHQGNNLKTVFFGHSLGSILAFELIRQFEMEGIYDVIHLVCSGAPSPRDLTLLNKSHLKRHGRTDAEFYDHLKRIGGIYEGLDPDFLRKSVNNIRTDHRLLDSYRFDAAKTYLDSVDRNNGRITHPITTLRGVVDPYVTQTAMIGWKNHSNSVTRHEECGDIICGDHFYYNNSMIRDSLLSLLKKIA